LLAVAGCTGGDDGWRTQLGDPDPNVRRAAIRTVELLPDSAIAVSALVPVARDADQRVRVAAALAILKIDPQNLVCRPEIERALRNGEGPVFIALGRCGDRGTWAVPTLVELMQDRRAPIRALSAQTLGELGATNEKVDSSLRRGLRDDSPAVRSACERALERLTSAADSPPSSKQVGQNGS
jgi:HEAT repeat protein